jgi:hypothetical protein
VNGREAQHQISHLSDFLFVVQGLQCHIIYRPGSRGILQTRFSLCDQVVVDVVDLDFEVAARSHEIRILQLVQLDTGCCAFICVISTLFIDLYGALKIVHIL